MSDCLYNRICGPTKRYMYVCSQWRTQKFFSGRGVQQIQVTEGRENRDLGAVAPKSGVPPNLQMGETHILIRFLGCIFHGTGNSARLCQNLGIISGGLNPPSGYASDLHSQIFNLQLLNRESLGRVGVLTG
jgi:hypothetical protein